MDNTFINEQWKPLPPEFFDDKERVEISNFGRLRKLKKNEFKIVVPSKIKGYPIVNIKLPNGKRTTKYIHKLVGMLFLPGQGPKQTFVVHLDYNKENNHVKNLKWVDRVELVSHQYKNPEYKKGIVRYSKLTETDVIRLKKKLKRGKNPLYKIAKEFGITHTQLNRIRKGENWGHITID
ncbi:MAG: hypothetical protein CVU09_16060 [Bacteroidetes bacterium HGW-Bacteroidetes-4]|jgi:hypothetical protein|nr:MAG: hypothetical protein CVU09_16060 [Bacteroidetes bacterium HGW-Bacteroidetes-4]